MSPPRDDITGLLNTTTGTPGSADDLWAAVYPELRRRARGLFRNERSNHTLSATGVVNEAFLRLAQLEPREWKNRAQFYAVASHIMRQVLVDHARRHAAIKRGGGGPRQPLDEEVFPSVGDDPEGFRIAEEALERLAERQERPALVVALRVFGGLTVPEVARELGVSDRTVKVDWMLARAQLRSLLVA
jgi:RNA polymerase sigma factor (TIGR02999 family)